MRRRETTSTACQPVPVTQVPYDEFGLFHENAAEFGLPYDGPPVVRRTQVEVAAGRHLERARLGRRTARARAPPRRRAERPHLGHGGDGARAAPSSPSTCPAMGTATGRPRTARRWPPTPPTSPPPSSSSPPTPSASSGMSLGGMTTMALVDARPDLVRAVVLVDITPGVNQEKASAIVAFVDGPESFPDFDELLERTKQFNPTRTESSLRRGILHNALQREDGSWVWRYRRFIDRASATGLDVSDLWDAVGRITVPGHARAGHAPAVGRGRRRRGRAPAPPPVRPRGARRGGRPQRAGRRPTRTGPPPRRLPARAGTARDARTGSPGCRSGAKRRRSLFGRLSSLGSRSGSGGSGSRRGGPGRGRSGRPGARRGPSRTRPPRPRRRCRSGATPR